MSKLLYYKQCRLTKKVGNSHLKTVSWIPEKFAKIGLTISLKDDTMESGWSDDWLVESASERVEAKYVENQAHNSKDIWTATSGSCPRGNK